MLGAKVNSDSSHRLKTDGFSRLKHIKKDIRPQMTLDPKPWYFEAIFGVWKTPGRDTNFDNKEYIHELSHFYDESVLGSSEVVELLDIVERVSHL